MTIRDTASMCHNDCAVHCGQECSCQSWPPEGPAADCVVHGAVRALNEATVEIDRLRAKIAELTEERDDLQHRAFLRRT